MLYVTCFCAPSSPNLRVKGKFLFSSFLFYKMTFDDESDPFCGEVSLWQN